jgi:Fe-S-cluster containining protein
MNVTISATEAALIERAADRKSSAPALSRAHDPKRFVGTPCPFLKESACTIYSARPLACRMHLSFDTSAYWCQPERMHLAEMPMLRFEGLVDAYFTLIGSDVTADIRDFFPGR